MQPLIDQTVVSKTMYQNMIETLVAWSAINTHSENLAGLNTMLAVLESAMTPLGGKSKRIALPNRQHIDSQGQHLQLQTCDALHIEKRPEAPLQIILGGHFDTVFEAQSAFQKPKFIENNRLCGPGVADMKGGLLILLNSLLLLERSPLAANVGWQILLTPDEEIGSPSSEKLYSQAATTAHYGLIFEPAFPDGKLVSQRKGSYNFAVFAHGRAAHAGRDFHSGRNAIVALAHFVTAAHALNQKYPDVTLNIGNIGGGEASNIVPKLAYCYINVRGESEESLFIAAKNLMTLAKEATANIAGNPDGLEIQVHPMSHRLPKPFSASTQELFETVKRCGQQLGIEIDWKSSGGVCDGNILAQSGLPTVDTLGAVGGNLHTFEEYIELPSLAERTSLATLLLLTIASKQI